MGWFLRMELETRTIMRNVENFFKQTMQSISTGYWGTKLRLFRYLCPKELACSVQEGGLFADVHSASVFLIS